MVFIRCEEYLLVLILIHGGLLSFLRRNVDAVDNRRRLIAKIDIPQSCAGRFMCAFESQYDALRVICLGAVVLMGLLTVHLQMR